MTNAELIAKIKAEIVRGIEWLNTATGDFAEGRRAELRSLYDFIDSLQEEQLIKPELKEEKIECSPVIKEFISKFFEVGRAYNFGFGPKDFLQEQSEVDLEKPMNPDDAMKELDEKIALVKQRGTWDGVDVDKYMDEVRGREPGKPIPADLEEAANHHICKTVDAVKRRGWELETQDITDAFIAGAKWQKEQYHFFNEAWAENMQAELDRNYENGKQAMKEQMMKTAVEGEVIKDNRGNNVLRVGLLNNGFEIGDKVRIIVLPKWDSHE